MNIVKLEEASRNELLALTKGETITRYNKASGYKGFSITNIDTTNVLRDNSLVVTCKVGDYQDTVVLQDILHWVQIVAENTNSYTKNQINTKVVTQAIMNSIDGFDIKVDCTCADWQYRFAYAATQLGYKYGKPENRPNQYKRTNKDNKGALCKHLTSMLSNKRWLQQVTSTFMDWLEKNIEKVNKYLNLKGDNQLTLPNELARQNAKLSWQTRKNKDVEPEQPEETQDVPEQPTNNVNGNNPSTNKINNIDTEDVEQPE